MNIITKIEIPINYPAEHIFEGLTVAGVELVEMFEEEEHGEVVLFEEVVGGVGPVYFDEVHLLKHVHFTDQLVYMVD